MYIKQRERKGWGKQGGNRNKFLRRGGCGSWDVVVVVSFGEREGTSSMYVYLEKEIGKERKKGFLEEKQMLM